MSSASSKAAAPLAFRASIAALLLALAGLAALWLWGFGDLDAGYAVQPPSFAVAYAALFTAALVAALAAVRLRRHGTLFRSAAKDGKAPSRGPVLAVFAVLTVVEAAPVGYGLLRGRNALSDDAMFAVATRSGGPAARDQLARYAAKGHRHVDEASARFLAELGGDRERIRQASKEGGPLAIQAADALVEADWEQATKTGGVGALSSFLRQNPGSKHDDEARQRVHAMYAAGREKARERKLPPDAERFRDALLDNLDKRLDNRVTVVVTAATAKSVEQADEEYAAKYGARYVRAMSRFSRAALDDLSVHVREAVAKEVALAYPGGLVEVTDSIGDEGRPILGVDLTPVAYAAQTWGSPDDKADKAGDTDVVTPVVGFLVEVQGVIHGHDGRKTTTAWRLKLEDDTEAKMEIAPDAGADGSDAADARRRLRRLLPGDPRAHRGELPRAALISVSAPRTTTPP